MTRPRTHPSPERPARRRSADTRSIATRIAGYDWRAIAAQLDSHGHARLAKLLKAAECRELAALYADAHHFRTRIRMAQHGFGRGEYQYFSYPLPKPILGLRTDLYPHLAEIANDWNRRLAVAERYPAGHAAFLRRCHDANQTRPTPLLLRYVAGDFNCLHQDTYGAVLFPLQLTILLSRPERDFRGGEFVLTEQRPRRQSRVDVVPLDQGDAVVFAVRDRPVQGTRGVYRAKLRHGVSPVHSGVRQTLGIIFHDAA